MREIKFRAWDTLTKRMMHNVESAVIMTRRNIEFKVMQYTGLKDSKGKEIYEGDIVTADYKVITSRYKVVIEDGHTQLVRHPIRHFLDRANRDIYEVIGNIYENPELLDS